MKNKNGFIATSLIYSFFLIFITLFLTIIADYLQNKVLLNTLEKDIKKELNSTFSANDFEVGMMVNFNNEANSTWVVAGKDYKYDMDGRIINIYLILYSYDSIANFPSTITTIIKDDLIYDNLINDIDIGYRNGTYLNKIIYTFDSEFNNNYNLDNQYYVLKNCDDNITGKDTIFSLEGNNCIINSSFPESGYGTSSNKTRKRVVLDIKDETFIKIEESVDGTIILEG